MQAGFMTHDTNDRTAGAAAGQVSTSAAEVYEQFFVPALFGQWAESLLDAAAVRNGDRVLDIGTGTGVVARAALRRVGDSGSVVGVDPNEGMLAVARRRAPHLDLRRATAERLPLEDDSVDAITCQFALMFFDDTNAAISEMARVLKPERAAAVATWAAVDESPGYAAMVRLLDDQLGAWAADAMSAPFTIGTTARLERLLEPHFGEISIERHDGTARFESLDAWMHTDIRGWTLADHVDDDEFAALLDRARSRLADFVGADGRVEFGAPALIATASN